MSEVEEVAAENLGGMIETGTSAGRQLATLIQAKRGPRLMAHCFGNGPDAYRLHSLVSGGDAKRGSDMVGQIILATHWCAHQVQIESAQGGEMIEATRVVLVDVEGEAFAFVSDGVLDSLGLICNYFGLGPWSPPLVIQVRQQTTRRGWRFLQLVVESVGKPTAPKRQTTKA